MYGPSWSILWHTVPTWFLAGQSMRAGRLQVGRGLCVHARVRSIPWDLIPMVSSLSQSPSESHSAQWRCSQGSLIFTVTASLVSPASGNGISQQGGLDGSTCILLRRLTGKLSLVVFTRSGISQCVQPHGCDRGPSQSPTYCRCFCCCWCFYCDHQRRRGRCCCFCCCCCCCCCLATATTTTTSTLRRRGCF